MGRAEAIRILFLLTELPIPVTNGGRAKVYSMLSALSNVHDCYVLSFGDPAVEWPIVMNRETLKRVHILDIIPPIVGKDAILGKVLSIIRRTPPSFASFASGRFLLQARQACERYEIDAICYDLINMAQFRDLMPDLPSVHSPNDATSRNHFLLVSEYGSFLERAYSRISAHLLRHYEKKHYHKFQRIHVVSKESASYLKELDNRLRDKLFVISMSVGAEYFLRDIEPAPLIGREGIPQLLFAGNISNPGVLNGLLNFVDKGLEKVCQAFPNLRFVILSGGAKNDELRKRVSRFSCIEVVKWVEDYRSILMQSHVFITPDTTGPGPKTRILQALAAGVPMVASKEALEGISYENGKHLWQCSNAAQMGDRLIELFASEDKRRLMAYNARILGLLFCSDDAVDKQWRALFEGLK